MLRCYDLSKQHSLFFQSIFHTLLENEYFHIYVLSFHAVFSFNLWRSVNHNTSDLKFFLCHQTNQAKL